MVYGDWLGKFTLGADRRANEPKLGVRATAEDVTTCLDSIVPLRDLTVGLYRLVGVFFKQQCFELGVDTQDTG